MSKVATVTAGLSSQSVPLPITAEPQTTATDGGNTFELVCGRETNHLAGLELGGFPSNGHVHETSNATQDKSSARHQQQGDTGYVSQPSCSATLNREGRSQTAFECTADKRWELVPRCWALQRVDRPPVGIRDLPLPRYLLSVNQEHADAEARASAAAAVEK